MNARPLSLILSLTMGAVTIAHHVHAEFFVDHDGPGLHVVWNELFILPATVIAYLLWGAGYRAAKWAYGVIALAGFAGLGLYEGAWNHGAKVLAYLRLSPHRLDLAEILPAHDPHLWFYEATGIATGVVAFAAGWASWVALRDHGSSGTSQ